MDTKMKNRMNGKKIGVCIIFGLFILFLMLQQQGLYMQHDDYAYGCLSYGKDYIPDGKYYHIGDVIKYLAWHYQNWGGRVTFYFIMILLLRLGIQSVRIFQSLILFLTTICTYLLLEKELKVRYSVILALASCLMYGFYGLGVFSDGVMWIAAASTYVWAMPFFLGAVCMEEYYKNSKKTWALIISGLLYIFAASSQEQIAILTIAFTGLRFLNKTWNIYREDGKSLRKAAIGEHVVMLLLTVSGGAFEILAPGNFGRMDSEENAWFYALSLPERIGVNINNLLSSNLGLYNHMMFFAVVLGGTMMAVWCLNRYAKNKKLCMLHVINSIFGIASFVYAVIRYQNNRIFLNSFLIEGLVFLWFSTNLLWILYVKKNRLVTFLYIGGICSQLMMLVSPTITVRTSIPMGLMFQISIVCIVLYCIQDIPKKIWYLLPVVLMFFSVWNLSDVTKGFLHNGEVHAFNKEVLEEYEQNLNQGIQGGRILLAKLYNDAYGNQQPYQQQYIESFIRRYYNIPNEVDIAYVEYDSILAYYDKDFGYIKQGDFYNDAWFGQNGTLTLNTDILKGKQKFALEVAIPEENQELTLTITYGAHTENYTVKSGDNSIRFSLGELIPGQDLKIQSSKTQEAGDGRVLSFIVYQLFFE